MIISDVLPTTKSGDDSIGIYTTVLLLVTVASILSIILLCFSYFDVPLIIFGTMTISFGLLKLYRIGIKLPVARISYTSICLIALALLLRSDLYPHQMGGQDQGLYVNMAEVLIQHKSLNFQDKFRQELTSEEKVVYDQSAMSSVPLVDDSNSIYTIEFYPLHPVWMAISKWLLGAGHHTISLLLFAFLGIIGGYYLTKELFDNERAAIIAAFFLSVNPALVFFSKYPVGEIVAFAFSINGFLFLLRSVQASADRVRWLYWLIALLCFNCFFFVRMQFFMYIPFFCLLFLIFLIKKSTNEQQTKTRFTIVSFVVALFLTFALSLLFYFVFQSGLFDAMILGHILSLVNPKLLIAAAAGSLALLAVFLATSASPSRISRVLGQFDNLVSTGGKLIPWLLPVMLLASLPSIVNLYHYGSMSPFSFSIPTEGDRWLIRYHALYRLGLMLSPIGLVILFAVPFFRTALVPKALLFILFLSTVWFSILLQPWIPYLYYYGRYLVSEMLPYSLILIAVVLSFLISSKKNIGRIMLFLIGLYFLAFSMLQYNKQESEEQEFYNEIVRNISKRDVVLVSGLNDQQNVPLRISYELSVFPLSDRHGKEISINPDILKRLTALAENRGGHLLWLTLSRINEEGTLMMTKMTFNSLFITNGEHIRKEGIHSPGKSSIFFLPTSQQNAKSEFYLYKVDANKIDYLFGSECPEMLDLTNKVMLITTGLRGFSVPEPHGRWSDGNFASYDCKIPLNGRLPTKIVLELTGYVPNNYEQNVVASVNHGTEVRIKLDVSNPHQKLEIPLTGLVAGSELSLELKFPNAKSPSDFGLSSDARKLGASVSRITLE